MHYNQQKDRLIDTHSQMFLSKYIIKNHQRLVQTKTLFFHEKINQRGPS